MHRGCEFIMEQSRNLGRSGPCVEEEGWVLTPVLARELHRAINSQADASFQPPPCKRLAPKKPAFLPGKVHMAIFRSLFFSKITGGTNPNLQNVASFQSHRGRLEGFSNATAANFPLKWGSQNHQEQTAGSSFPECSSWQQGSFEVQVMSATITNQLLGTGTPTQPPASAPNRKSRQTGSPHLGETCRPRSQVCTDLCPKPTPNPQG